MQNRMLSFHHNQSKFRPAQVALLLAVAALMLCWQSTSIAAVNAAGDVSPKVLIEDVDLGGVNTDVVVPDLPGGGGQVGGNSPTDLIVGGTGSFSGTIIDPGGLNILVPTTVGEVAINAPAGTAPLVAPNVIIGMGQNGQGRINLNDFGSTLLVNGSIGSPNLVVGGQGRGELNIIGGSQVLVGIPSTSSNPPLQYTGGETTIGESRDTFGDTFTSEGLVVIDGFGSRLESEDLIVGEEGLGTVEISDSGYMLTDDAVLGDQSESEGRVWVSGVGSAWSNLDKIDVGGSGRGIIDVSDQGLVTSEDITVGSNGEINLSSGGRVLLHDGGDEIELQGVIRGDGRVESSVVISSSGELRNAAATANQREHLLVTGEVDNDGTIESLGGEMEFQSTVTNREDIIASDAVMRFLGGLTNRAGGNLFVSGETTLHGNINSSAGGLFTVLPNSEILAVSDVDFSGSVGSLTTVIGGGASSLSITGEATLDGFLDLSSFGTPSVVGDSYDILTASGGVLGTFDSDLTIAGGLVWSITYELDVVTVTAGGMAMPMGADFNGDGVVDVLDLGIWEMYYGATGVDQTMGDADGDGDVDGLDFLKIQMDLGGPPSLAALVAAVPEPSALLLALSALAFGYRRRTP
jgi:T5SS/PEP-CTERM-associated repeat protein